jgi:DNA-binding XRE family transcriptional regulator
VLDLIAMRDRRREPTATRCDDGKRWSDDPDLASAFERVALQLSADVHALRDAAFWSQDRAALASGLNVETIGDIEGLRTDPRLSTLVRLAFTLGRRVQIRFVR